MKDIIGTVREAGSFGVFLTACEACEFDKTMVGEGSFTLFAPNDAAFAKVPKEALDSLLKDKERLTTVLRYHLVSGKVRASSVVGLSSLRTVEGGRLSIDTTEGIKVDNAKVIQTDIESTNGVIHVIDAVLMPK